VEHGRDHTRGAPRQVAPPERELVHVHVAPLTLTLTLTLTRLPYPNASSFMSQMHI